MRGRIPQGSTKERFEDMSFLQLRLPKPLHLAFRALCLNKGISVNSISEDMVRVYMAAMKEKDWQAPDVPHSEKLQAAKKLRVSRARRPIVPARAVPCVVVEDIEPLEMVEGEEIIEIAS